MQEIESETRVNGQTCIQFPLHSGENGYIKFVNGSGCHIPIGYIGRQSSVTIGDGCQSKGIVMHELLHSLGFWHEEDRPDRDLFVTIHINNVQNECRRGFSHAYYYGYVDTLGQPYDYGSIMHSGAYVCAINKSEMTIEPKTAGVTIGQRLGLSKTDIKKIQLLYDCIPNPGTSVPLYTYLTVPPVTTTEAN